MTWAFYDSTGTLQVRGTGERGPTGSAGTDGGVGLTGPPGLFTSDGEDGFSLPGPRGVAAGQGAFTWMSRLKVQTGIGRRFYAPRAGTFTGVFLWATDNAPTGTATFDVLLNGTSIFLPNPRPTITAANFLGTEVTLLATTAFAAADKIEISIISSGGVTSGRMGAVIKFAYT